MPIYQYTCEFGHLHEEYQSIKDFDRTRVIECKECGNNMESYFGEPPLGFVRNDPTTVGQLGEANYKALGKVRQEEMMYKKKEDEDAARRRCGGLSKEQVAKARRIHDLTPEQKMRYAQTGKLPPGKSR